MDNAIDISETDEIMIIGGGQLYAATMPMATRMILTLIDIEPEADTWFPEWDEGEWRKTSEEYYPVDDNNKLAYRIVELKRITSP